MTTQDLSGKKALLTGASGFIGRHASPDCEVWIVDPERGNRPAFSRRLQDLGFVASQTRLDSAATAQALAYRGRMLTYRRCCDERGRVGGPAAQAMAA